MAGPGGIGNSLIKGDSDGDDAPVLMTVDAGNLFDVAENARAVWPDSQFIFCADNDHHLKNSHTGEPENKSILSATKPPH